MALLRSTVAAVLVGLACARADDDPYLWLEDITSPRALAWVHEQDAATARRLTADPRYAGLYRDALTVLNSASRIPEVEPRGGHLYDFWRDRDHPRGIFRRVTPDGFRAAEPPWETLLDFDALARAESRPWAYGGAVWPWRDESRCLISLALGGGDTVEVREFDPAAKRFIPGGFAVPLAKSTVTWRDADSLLVATDFGPGTLTTSGYPSQVRLWRRGTPLRSAQLLYTAPASSVDVRARRLHLESGDPVDVVSDDVTFWRQKHFQVVDGRLVPLRIPESARLIDSYGDGLVIWLKEPWAVDGQTFPPDAIVTATPARLRGEPGSAPIRRIVTPANDLVVSAVDCTPTGVLVSALDQVRGRLYRYHPGQGGRELIAFPDQGALTVQSTDERTGDAWVQYESFLIPPTLYFVGGSSRQPERIKAQAPTFDATRFAVRQFVTASADGTPVHYFVVGPKRLADNGAAPVWMFSYGGFEVALTPSYSGSYEDLHGAYGKLWLERGGVFVLANIRGGGEYGPAWHDAAIGPNHVRAFEDFEAVARDIERRKITSPAHLGIEGRSNGGLLVAATMLRHPELYGAVVCGNPLLDMRRYHRLLAGASWMAEYGDPDKPEDWAFIRRYSPYQNVHPGMKLPPILFYTSTRDDRVHPGHARKMAAKMEAMGYAVDYYENTEGGHHGSVTSEELATRLARTYTFLWEKVGPGGPAAGVTGAPR